MDNHENAQNTFQESFQHNNIIIGNTLSNSFNSDSYSMNLLKQRTVRTQIISQKFKAGLLKENKENYRVEEDDDENKPPRIIGLQKSQVKSKIESSNQKDNQGSDFKKRLISDLAMKI